MFRSNGLLTAVELNPEKLLIESLTKVELDSFSGFNANSTAVNNPFKRNTAAASPLYSSMGIPTNKLRGRGATIILHAAERLDRRINIMEFQQCLFTCVQFVKSTDIENDNKINTKRSST